ncbi:MAG TPA: MFS transporter [Pirellulales bacterium]|jgi:MFS family permease|nr:MFS transporter [Pirellulales bacterium]
MPLRGVRSLRHRNFRLFFAGQLVSLCGTWLQQVAMTWLVWELSHRPSLLGYLSFASQIPMLLLAPVAGAISEHWNRRRALLVTQSLAMAQALVLGVLTLEGWVRVEHVFVLALALGMVNAFDMPLRQAFLHQMVVERDDLANAIALNSSMVNGARLVGPALAGVLIDLVGEGWCFVLNGLSYLAVLAALAAMQIVHVRPPVAETRLWTNLHGGFRYAFTFTPIRAILSMVAITSITSMPLSVLMPVFASEKLGGGAGTLGLLTSAMGIGALGSAMYLAARRSVLGLGRVMALAALGFALGMIAFSFSDTLVLSLPILALSGFCMMLQMASSNTLLQTIVDPDKRGRVMGLYGMSFLGVAPIGSLSTAYLARPDVLGSSNTLRLAGAICLAGGIVFLFRLRTLREQVRPVYRKLGILPEIAAGLQASAQLNTPPERT